jgi:hypothetical protein
VRRFGTVEEVRSWGTTRERYEIEVAGLAPSRLLASGGDRLAFPGCGIDVRSPQESGPGDRCLLQADVEKGGPVLTELLRRLLAAGGTIVACSRREASLQEVFDLVAAEGAGEAAEREEHAAKLRGDPADREYAR